MGPKKGVISQSVKDVVQSLVDDDLVLKDKIGTSVSELLLSGKNTAIPFYCAVNQHGLIILSMFISFTR